MTSHQRIVGCDLDGTLAQYDKWEGPDKIGEPIPAMVEKVKQAIAEGSEVWIFTARVNPGIEKDHAISAALAMVAIVQWCQKVFGTVLPITYTKSYRFTEIWDDRAKQVIENTGEFLEDHIQELAGAMR